MVSVCLECVSVCLGGFFLYLLVFVVVVNLFDPLGFVVSTC